jgi:non-ribosomal peptide synthetase component F
LQGLPKLSLLRAEPISILALIQSLRAAGSTLPLETADAIERLKPLFSGLQPKMAIISPSLVNLSAEQSRNRENQRKLTSAHFVHQERFLDSLLLTVNSVRYQKLQAPLSHKYRTIAEAAVTILLID